MARRFQSKKRKSTAKQRKSGTKKRRTRKKRGRYGQVLKTGRRRKTQSWGLWTPLSREERVQEKRDQAKTLLHNMYFTYGRERYHGRDTADLEGRIEAAIEKAKRVGVSATEINLVRQNALATEAVGGGR